MGAGDTGGDRDVVPNKPARVADQNRCPSGSSWRYAIFQMVAAVLPQQILAGVLTLINGLRGPPGKAVGHERHRNQMCSPPLRRSDKRVWTVVHARPISIRRFESTPCADQTARASGIHQRP